MRSFYLITITTLILIFSCEKEQSPELIYPEIGLYGNNILDKNSTEYFGSEFSFTSELLNGAKLKIVLTSLENGLWGSSIGTNINWSISTFDDQLQSQIFQTVNTNLKCELKMIFEPGSYKIDYYEMDSSEITYTKTISIK